MEGGRKTPVLAPPPRAAQDARASSSAAPDVKPEMCSEGIFKSANTHLLTLPLQQR